MNPSPATLTAQRRPLPPTSGVTVSRASWSAIFTGAVIAIALMIMLAMLGVGLGASTIDPLSNEGSAAGKGIGSAIYFVISQLLALGAGGYVASKMGGVPRLIPSAIHGSAVWAVATIGMVWIASSAAGTLIGGSASIIGSTASGLAKTGSAAIPDDLEVPDLSFSAISLDDFPKPVRQAMRERGITEENFKDKARTAFQTVIDEGERARAKSALTTALKAALSNPSDISAHFDRLTNTLSGPGGIFTEENKRQSLQVMQQQFGVSEQEAQAAYDGAVARYNKAVQGAQKAVAEVKQESLEAADRAARAISQAGFAAFFASLLGLLAAAGAAIVGRPNTLLGSETEDYVRS